MALVKGLREGGVINVSKDIFFSGNVAMKGGSDFVPKRTDIYYVDGTDGNDENSGKTPHRALLTIGAAVTKAGNWDRIYIAHDSSNYSLSETLTWSYNGGAIIGNAITPMQPYLDIDMADATTFNPMIEVSGRGNVFANLTFEHGSRVSSGVGYATDLTCMKVSGRYNYFENVYFYTPMYPEQDVANTNVGANDGYYGVEVSGHNNYFRGCKFGSDGMNREELNFNVLLHGGVGNFFEDCFFQMGADGTSPLFIGVDSVPRDMKLTQFLNCRFYVHSANYGTTIGDAIAVHGGGNTAGVYFDNRCQFINVSNVSDTANDTWVWKPVIGADETITAAQIALRNQGA